MGPPGGGHGVSEEQLFSMFEAQCTWDAAMAYNAVRALEARPEAIMVVLVGSGHVAYGLGIQRQAEQWFDGKVATLVPVPVGEDPHHPAYFGAGVLRRFHLGCSARIGHAVPDSRLVDAPDRPA